MRRRLVHAVLCLGLVATLAPAASAQTGAGKTLRVSLNGDENNMTPFTVSFGATPYTHDLILLVYDSLFWSQVKHRPGALAGRAGRVGQRLQGVDDHPAAQRHLA